MTWSEVRCDFSPEGRSWHSLTAISEEEALLYGGLSNSRRPLSDCFLFNVRLKRWLTVAVRAEPRLWHSAVFSARDQQVFIYGGGTSDILDHSIKTSEVSDRSECSDNRAHLRASCTHTHLSGTLHYRVIVATRDSLSSRRLQQTYTNDLITLRFRPDSLLHLCLDACSASAAELRHMFSDLPRSLARVLELRTGGRDQEAAAE